MKLSMWMILEYLREYHPTPYIRSGEMVLRNVRLLSDTGLMTSSSMYLARGGEFIDSAGRQVICVHNQDMILLETEDMDEVFNKVMDCFDFYNAWSDSCLRAADSGGTMQDFPTKQSGISGGIQSGPGHADHEKPVLPGYIVGMVN